VTTGIITSQGVAAMMASWKSGTPLQLSTVKISSDVMACTGAEVTMTDIVYTVPSSMVSITASGNGLTITLSLDETVGTFIIGTVGVYTADGNLFALAPFVGTGLKIANYLPATIGNIRTLSVLLSYDNLSVMVSAPMLTALTLTAQNAFIDALIFG
jgi:hypothetical protein